MKKIFTSAMLGCALFAIPASAQLQMPAYADPIEEAEGTVKDYIKTYDGCYAYMDIEYIKGQEVEAQIVWGDDNTVYFPNLISMMPTGTYTKATLEGSKITMTLPQTAYYEEYEYGGELIQSYMIITLVEPIDYGGGMILYEPFEGDGEVTFSVAEDGSVTMDPIPNGMAIGLVGDESAYGQYWMGFAEFAMSFVPDSNEAFDPSTLPSTPYSYFTRGYDMPDSEEPEFGYKVNVAFDGDDVYFFGLSLDEPRWWVKGQREGNKIIIDNNQKMGTLMNTYTVSLMFGKNDPEAYGGMSLMPADTKFVFNYDEEKNEFTTDTPEVIMIINALPDRIYSLWMLENPTFIYQPNAAGTPRDPWNFKFYDTYDRLGYGTLDFYLPIVSTDNVLLDRNNMYYQIYIDGELQELDAAEYGFSKDTVNVPYNFDANAIVCSNLSTYHEMIFHVEGFDTIGVKLFNVYDGVTYESNLVELNMETGEVSGISKISDTANVVSETYYDLSGKKVENPANGIFVKRIVLDNGTVRNIKCIVR